MPKLDTPQLAAGSVHYKDYYRDEYRYEFVQKQVIPYHDAYVRKSNTLKQVRNQAYFNLGLKHRDSGNLVVAFFFFRDAFRLSKFVESGGDHIGLRYKAEIEMKKILGIEEMGSYVYWN